MSQECWKEFFGENDSEDVLTQKAITLSSFLINTTTDDIGYIFNKAKDLNLELKGEKLEFFFDLLIQKIKLADGLIILYLRGKRRVFFTNSLIISVGTLLVKGLEELFSKKVNDGLEKVAVTSFYDFCYENLKEYDEYTELSDLLWHFNKKLAKKYTKNNDLKNIAIFTKAIVETFYSVPPK